MKRLAITALAFFALALSASAAELSGDWTLTGNVKGIAIDLKCYFDQTGESLDGSCDGPLGSPATTGSIIGNKVKLLNILTKGQDFTLVYTGTLDATGSSVSGTIASGQSSGTFVMKKKATPPPVTSAEDVGFSGTWVFIGDVEGDADNMRCTFQGQGEKFTGTCTYEVDGDTPTTGTIAGKTVTFQNRVTRDQVVYDLTFTGTLDDTETSMQGEIAVNGMTGEFSGKKAD